MEPTLMSTDRSNGASSPAAMAKCNGNVPSDSGITSSSSNSSVLKKRIRRSSSGGGGVCPPATANVVALPQQQRVTRASAAERETEDAFPLQLSNDRVTKDTGGNKGRAERNAVTSVTSAPACNSNDAPEEGVENPTSTATNGSLKSSSEMRAEQSDSQQQQRRRRRQWWWWRQQRRRRRRSASQANRQVVRNKCEPASQGRLSPSMWHSALYMNPNVRCVGSDGLPYNRTLKELLLARDAAPADPDTPCLGPSSAPLCVLLDSGADIGQLRPQLLRQQSQAGECSDGNLKATSPMITFTLDGVATPKTFAAIKHLHQQELDTATLPASCVADGHQSGRATQPRPPPHALRMQELPHQFLLRNYVNGSFLYYRRAEDKQRFLGFCREILAKARPIFEAESLFPCIVAPTFVLGDIHGNFEDLAFFLRNILIFHDLRLTPANILCLGDYVDRGPFSLECLMLLLSLKISHPSKVVMLRGNHEDRVVCGDALTYGTSCFLAQCEGLYGMEEGRQLFKEVTALFRHFPLAAELIIPTVPNINSSSYHSNNNDSDASGNPEGGEAVGAAPHMRPASQNPQGRRTTHEERVLCTHGGIPRFFGPPKDDGSLTFLRHDDFPRMLTLFPNNPSVKDDPEAQIQLLNTVGQTPASSTTTPKRTLSDATLQKAWFIAFDLMWSDPTSSDPGDEASHAVVDASVGERVALNEWGFGVNKRGSNVLTFSAKAVDTFLQAHQYSMLFRAHQEKAHGLRLSKSSKVLTIFSSSNYLGHGNGAGCVVVAADGEIQLVEKMSS
ncbi:serine/threonine protein phosphatase-like protein [Trypanosoma grayi]|uniref:serine/threonine protein phosphatase-like protein n=1 Tax=Trypanosoma grayi TaxID=71804 RepID=UPI0004F42637|nr:serine/threonine protein phosphatase-like protein [Trypanosoma grayi]KEG07621.1 serine/threonine protein phosphatase-like protein [Trypanosoma grayi]